MRRTIFNYPSIITSVAGNRPWVEWEKRTLTASKLVQAETNHKPKLVEVDFSKYNPTDYLLNWATAVAGVEVEDDGHTIVVPHSRWVNDNGNAWVNQTLLENYHSFILAENYLEHIQIPELSKGKILDAVAWVRREKHPNYRETLPTVFVDVLIATNKKEHPDLCKEIVAKKLNAISMGCDISWSQCSHCGRKIQEGQDDPCRHIQSELRKIYRSKDGMKRITAEFCGLAGKPGSCTFIEASWVRVPAFQPAILHSMIGPVQHHNGWPLKAVVPASRVNGAALS